jgi:putative FmdB family regulatory protein
MPIYEFKCNQCDECFEILLMKSREEEEAKCPACGSQAFERVMSCTHYAVTGTGARAGAQRQTRTCSGGSCSTVELPGPD